MPRGSSKKAFLAALNKVLKNKAAYEALYESELKKLSDTTVLESQRAQAEEALQDALESLQEIIRENTQYKQDQTAYLAKYNAQKDVVNEKKQLLKAAKKAIIEQTAKKEKLRRFMNALALCDDEATEFQDEVFTLAINRILVEKGEKVKLVFCFTDGSEITQMVAD